MLQVGNEPVSLACGHHFRCKGWIDAVARRHRTNGLASGTWLARNRKKGQSHSRRFPRQDWQGSPPFAVMAWSVYVPEEAPLRWKRKLCRPVHRRQARNAMIVPRIRRESGRGDDLRRLPISADRLRSAATRKDRSRERQFVASLSVIKPVTLHRLTSAATWPRT